MRRAGAFAGIILFLIMLLAPPPQGLSVEGWGVAAIAVLMAIWWFSEAVPFAVTALLPFLLLPVLKIEKANVVAASYSAPVIFLILGGSLLAVAIEKWGLHKRLATAMVRRAGSNPNAIILSMMAATAFISMWASNTATMIFMLPIAASVIAAITKQDCSDQDRTAYAGALVIGLAYAASMGGFGTIIASPSNAVSAGLISTAIGRELGFLTWMAFGVPVVIAGTLLSWFLLTRFAYRHSVQRQNPQLIADAIGTPALFSSAERRLLPVLLVAVFAWMAMPLLQRWMPNLTDATVAILAAMIVFFIPAGDAERGQRLLNWDDAKAVPWGVIVLVGGGIALADAMTSTGLGAWLGEGLKGSAALPPLLLLAISILVIIVVTEFASNIAAATAFVPALAALGSASGNDPIIFAMIGAFAAKWAFIVPAGSPWMAIALSSGHVRMRDMMRIGLVMDLFGIPILLLLAMAAQTVRQLS